MLRLLALTLGIVSLTGCVIAVDGSHDDDGPWWDRFDEDDDDREDLDDTDVPALEIFLTLDPASVPVGRTSLLVGTVEGDLGADDLVGIDFGEGIDVDGFRALDDVEFLIAVTPVDVPPGPREAHLVFEDGEAWIPDALEVHRAGGGSGGSGDDDTAAFDTGCF